ncbi:MAG: hypothetical protein QW343_01380 [Candidatus Norongarragalinales archaeon]
MTPKFSHGFACAQRLTPWPASWYDSHAGRELFITLRTLPCEKAVTFEPCAYCGLCKADAEYAGLGPLSEEELISQLNESKSQMAAKNARAVEKVRRVSIIGMTHSTISPSVIPTEVLTKGITELFKLFPKMTCIGFESRPEYLDERVLSEISKHVKRECTKRNRKVELELAIGVESGSESIRNEKLNKRVTDEQLFEVAKLLHKNGWRMRGYGEANQAQEGYSEQQGLVFHFHHLFWKIIFRSCGAMLDFRLMSGRKERLIS